MEGKHLDFETLDELALFVREIVATGWKNYFTETIFNFENAVSEPPVVSFAEANIKNSKIIESIISKTFSEVSIKEVLRSISPVIIKCFIRKEFDMRFVKKTEANHKSNMEYQIKATESLANSFYEFREEYIAFSSRPLFEEVYKGGENFSELGNSLEYLDGFIRAVQDYDREKLDELFKKKDFYSEEREIAALHLGLYFYSLYLDRGNKSVFIDEWVWIENVRKEQKLEPQEFSFCIGLQFLEFFNLRETLTIKGIKNLKNRMTVPESLDLGCIGQVVHYGAHPLILPEITGDLQRMLSEIHSQMENELVFDQNMIRKYRIKFYEMAKKSLMLSALDCRQSLEIVSNILMDLRKL